jgi:DNA repair exonuclease SbcCD ATPase subunit
MICRIGAVARTGPAVTVEQSVEPDRLLAAVRQRDRTDSSSADRTRSVVVDCEPPTPVHDYVGQIHPEMGLRTRTALAVGARTQGLESPHDDEMARLEDKLASISVAETDLESRRQERADEHNNRQRLRERVAATRGRLAAYREQGHETDELEAELQAQIQELAEAETTATAATQNHEQAQSRARSQRDQRAQQFRLEDRLANRRRDARRWLVEQVEPAFTTAVRELLDRPVEEPFDCRPAVAALAIARVAEYTAPILLETDQFASAAAAHDWLGGPVVLLR